MIIFEMFNYICKYLKSERFYEPILLFEANISFWLGSSNERMGN